MDRQTLSQYKSLQKEIPMLKKKLDRLYKRKENIPEVGGKVKASSKEYPYIEGYVQVKMDEPKEADKLKKLIKINEERMVNAEKEKLEIEIFISEIPNSTDRQIFEYVYLEGMKMKDVAEMFGYTKGRISQKISAILKD